MSNELFFNPSSEEVKYLSNKDPKIKYLFELIGELRIELSNDYFESLIKIIIGQQLSVKAAHTIWTRFKNTCLVVSPEKVLNMDNSVLKDIGISRSKASYIKDLSSKIKQNEINLNNLQEMDEVEIINCLTRVKGIGIWSAEMFLIFSLGKLNVLSSKDLGIKRSVGWLYGLEEMPEEKYIYKLKDKFSPYSTVVSLYLWELINRGIIK